MLASTDASYPISQYFYVQRGVNIGQVLYREGSVICFDQVMLCGVILYTRWAFRFTIGLRSGHQSKLIHKVKALVMKAENQSKLIIVDQSKSEIKNLIFNTFCLIDFDHFN